MIEKVGPIITCFHLGNGPLRSGNQGDAGGCMWNKDVTQSVAAVTTELKDHLSDITDKTVSGT
jgi:hypothetical protein